MTLLDNRLVNIIEEIPFLLLENKMEHDEDFKGFRLYLLEKSNKYVVYSDTAYYLDNSITREYRSSTAIKPPLTQDFERIFDEKEAAKEFMQKVLSSLPKVFDWSKYKDTIKYSGEFNQNEIFYNSFGEPYEIKDQFHSDLLIHGMQKVFIRAFLRESSVILNKKWVFTFLNEYDANIFFDDLNNHFSLDTPKVIPYQGSDFDREKLLSQISTIVSATTTDESYDMDSYGKIHEYELSSVYKGITVHIKLRLPSRNAFLNDVEVNSHISVEGRRPLNWYQGENPRTERALLEELKDVISYLTKL